MKELIEKIKELQDAFKFHCCQVTCSQIIGMIEDQELKPFTPTECGLIFDDDENGEHRWFIERQYKDKTLRTILNHVFDNKYSVCVYAFINNQWVFQFYVINIIKIPNHRQGVELLRNLGVIE